MSAILGRCEFDSRPVDGDGFLKATAAIAHYGGDGTGTLIDGGIALAHHQLNVARRATAETQPLRFGNLIVVADAVLDNREELTGALSIPAAEARLMPASMLILHAFRKWGEACPHQLIGDYAFAIYDTEKRKLFLARDHIGARPLYWYQHANTFLFATDIRGLVAHSDIDWRIDESMVAQYLANASKPLPKCFFKGMYFLEPGHFLAVDIDGTNIQRWWEPQNKHKVRYKKNADYVAHFRELTEQAVECRVDTELPVGSHISGGIDSTAVTLLASQFLKRNGRDLAATYAWAPQTSERHPDLGTHDERRSIQMLSDRANIPCRFGSSDEQENFEFLQWQLELDGTADLIDERPVIERAGADNIRVMLSGWGGDEAFSAHGFGYLSYLIKRGRLIHALKVNRTYAGGLRQYKNFFRSAWSNGVVPALPDILFERFTPFDEIYPRKSFAGDDLLKTQKVYFSNATNDTRISSKPIQYLCNQILRGHIRSRMDTWTAWAAPKGMQYRYPLTDRRLLEFVLALPPEQLFGNGQTRYLASTALADKLPSKPSKNDIANETYRSSVRKKCISTLTSMTKEGSIEYDCEWLDTDELQRALSNSPTLSEKNQVIDFVEIFAAIRILRVFQRHHSLKVPNCPPATKA